MRRHRALQVLAAACRDRQALSVATMQAVPVWHEIAREVPLHMDMLACMGSAASFGLGLALGAPERRVVVIDGDGSLLMQLGGLVTIAGTAAHNLILAVLHNGTYETSGNQPIPASSAVDLCGLACAAGFAAAHRVAEPDELDRRLQQLMDAEGPSFLLVDVAREEPCASWPNLSMAEQFQAVRTALAEGGVRKSRTETREIM